ncbi:MAG: hypothetical protein IKT40_12585 [Bacilli bacterium]|nr:hypothetical protein [Bacilli bacterium]
MSVDVRFDRELTLGMLKNESKFDIEYHKDFDMFIASKCYGVCTSDDQYIQIFIDKRDGCDINDIPIKYFTLLGSGSLMIKEISLKFQTRFLTDDFEEYLHTYDNVGEWCDDDWKHFYNRCMGRFGLIINDDNEIKIIN